MFGKSKDEQFPEYPTDSKGQFVPAPPLAGLPGYSPSAPSTFACRMLLSFVHPESFFKVILSSRTSLLTALLSTVTMNQSDRLRLIRFTDRETTLLRQSISANWPKGIQDERVYHGSYEFKLKGSPFFGQGSSAVPARRLMCGVLAGLYGSGWELAHVTDVSKSPVGLLLSSSGLESYCNCARADTELLVGLQYDKDTLIFRFATSPPPPSYFCSISFNEGDKLRLIGGPGDLQSAISALICSHFPLLPEWALVGSVFKTLRSADPVPLGHFSQAKSWDP